MRRSRCLPRLACGVLAGALCIGAVAARAAGPAGKVRAQPGKVRAQPAQPGTGPAPEPEPSKTAPPGTMTPPPSVPAPGTQTATHFAPGQPLTGTLPLSLPDAIAMGIENNLDIQIARFDPLTAEEDVISAWGYYDPNLYGSYLYSHRETPIASDLQQSRVLLEKEHFGAGGLQGEIPKLGWSYDISYTGDSLESSSSIQSLSPQYQTGVVANVTLPLLRDFLWNQPWWHVKTNESLAGRAQEDFITALMDIVQSIESSYWNLIASAENLRVANKSLEARKTLLDQTRAQYEVGVVSRVEVVEAEAGVADREVNRIRAENTYRQTQDTLINVVLGPNLTPDSTLEIEPTSQPDVVQYDVDAEAATAKAYQNRPELAAARYDVERAEVQQKFALNQLLPAVDAVGSYGYNGLAGRTSPTRDIFGNPRAPIPGIGRHYGDADNDFFGSDGARTWTAGATFSIPLGNVTGRAEKRKADLQLQQARTVLHRQEQQIVLDIRDAIRNLRSAQEGIEAAERSRLAAAEQFRAESIRLEHGESTPFDVLQREESLVTAEQQKILSLQIYRNSLAALDRAQGTILRDHNIVVEQARALR